jgi:hypothetical protein
MESPNVESPKPSSKKNIGMVAVVFVCLLLVVAAGIVIIPNLGRFSIPEAPEGYRYSGIASLELQDEATRLIEQQENALGCDTISLTSVEVLNLPQDVLDASWAEVWELDACGEIHSYAVNFIPNPAGGIDVSALRMEN